MAMDRLAPHVNEVVSETISGSIAAAQRRGFVRLMDKLETRDCEGEAVHRRGASTQTGVVTRRSARSTLSPTFEAQIEVRFGEGFRAPALCNGGPAAGAGARKPPKEETAGR